ncbi:MAG: extracellular solute-binding protein [Clostridia bacterium]
MRLKKIIATLLLASMTLSMVACSSSDSSTSTTDTSSSSSSSSSDSSAATTEAVVVTTEKGDGEYACSDTPIELDTFAIFQETYVLQTDQPIVQEIAAFTNVQMIGAASEYTSSSAEAFNLLMTKVELPDMIGGNYLDIAKYGAEGAFIPLNDLLEEYAPDIMAIFEKYPEVQAAMTSEDGNIYAVPFVYSDTLAQVWYIRQDWLDLLGLDMPTTVDEYEAVLTAFVNEDPNGNGVKDEIGFFMRQNNYDHNLIPLMSLWGIQDQWYVNADGEVAIGSYSQEFKAAMEGISDWYAKGLIDPEIFIADNYVRDQFFAADTGGSTHDWIPSTSGYNDSITEYVEDFFISAMLPPADTNGDVWEPLTRGRITGNAWGISCDNEYPVESIKLMNFLFTDKGRDIVTYGIEGETFTYNDAGEPIYTDDVLNSDQAVNTLINSMGGGNQCVAYLHDASYEAQMMSASGADDLDMYLEADVVDNLYPLIPTLSFTSDETEILTSTWVACRSYMCEKIEAWTYDGSLIEKEFDTYIETLQKMGMDDVVQVYNDAYARMMG